MENRQIIGRSAQKSSRKISAAVDFGWFSRSAKIKGRMIFYISMNFVNKNHKSWAVLFVHAHL
jgi:hypothetical protein